MATESLALRVPPDIKQWLVAEAQRKDTSMTAIIVALIEKERQEKGEKP